MLPWPMSPAGSCAPGLGVRWEAPALSTTSSRHRPSASVSALQNAGGVWGSTSTVRNVCVAQHIRAWCPCSMHAGHSTLFTLCCAWTLDIAEQSCESCKEELASSLRRAAPALSSCPPHLRSLLAHRHSLLMPAEATSTCSAHDLLLKSVAAGRRSPCSAHAPVSESCCCLQRLPIWD